MGYQTRVTGSITITPPLTLTELVGSPRFDPADDDEVVYHVDRVVTADGDTQTVVTTCAGIEPANQGQMWKRYDLLAQLNGIIAAHPAHTFAGHFDVTGEEDGDISRIVIRDGVAVEVRPELVWPGDAPTELDDLRAEVADLRALFDLQQRRMVEATARWRAEDPESRALVMPDLGVLLKWLMDAADTARAGGAS